MYIYTIVTCTISTFDVNDKKYFVKYSPISFISYLVTIVILNNELYVNTQIK